MHAESDPAHYKDAWHNILKLLSSTDVQIMKWNSRSTEQDPTIYYIPEYDDFLGTQVFDEKDYTKEPTRSAPHEGYVKYFSGPDAVANRVTLLTSIVPHLSKDELGSEMYASARKLAGLDPVTS